MIVTKSAIQTKKIASRFAKKITHIEFDRARVVALSGNLGAGKTTFIQGFAAALGIKEKIQSPTFVLMKVYALSPSGCTLAGMHCCCTLAGMHCCCHSRASGNPDPLLCKKKTRIRDHAGMREFCGGFVQHLVHIDAYRIETSSEMEHLGFHDLLKDKDAVILIEWADRVKKLLPKDTIWIMFEHGKNLSERIIEIKMQNAK